MKELVVISGKGGTGKTSVVASFVALTQNAVSADCDVDAADLHLVLQPKIRQARPFSGGSRARVLADICNGCGKCTELCRFDAVRLDGPANGRAERTYRIDPISCEGCGVCAWFCEQQAIRFAPYRNGQWFVSETCHGPMVHARLDVGAENSGKLVSLVRAEARKIATNRELDLILIDGAPGIGCPVIASITGADLVLVVAEPTLSGLHDMERVAQLTRHFGIPTLACVNKWDLNETLTEKIESVALEDGVPPVGRVRYDRAVTEAQIANVPVVELRDDGAAFDIRQLWAGVSERLRAVSPLRVVSQRSDRVNAK